ncbi:MAG: TusE/DsrC/DsvC family sulfur relay protein [Pseudomonadota bacterium]
MQTNTTTEGYLIDFNAWTEDVATTIASQEDLELTERHWQIIFFLRKYYEKYETIPPLRLLVRAIKKEFGEEIGNSIYLHQLFPQGVLRIACKIAGLPKPKHCM